MLHGKNELRIPTAWLWFRTNEETVKSAVEEFNALCDRLEEEFGLSICCDTHGIELSDENGIIDKVR